MYKKLSQNNLFAINSGYEQQLSPTHISTQYTLQAY
jgi:hypothetical protein